MTARKKAAPMPGAALLRKVRATLAEKGWPPGLTVLTGNDAFHLDAAQSAILEHLVRPEETEFALTVLGGGETKIGVTSAITAARSMGMFSPRRVVLVRDGAALDGEPDAIVDYAANPPEGSYLIVRAESLDQRRKLHKALATSGILLQFEVGEGEGALREAARQIASMAEERSLDLDTKVARFLVEAFRGDLYRIGSELDKIRSYLGRAQRAKVGIREIREVGTGSAALSGWEVGDAIVARDGAAALAASRRLLAAGSEPLQLLGGLASRARALLQGKAMLQNRRPEQDIVRATRAWFYRDALFQGLRKYSLEELLEFPRLLAEADRALKSSTMDPVSIMDTLIRGMTGRREGTGAERRA